MRWWLVVVVSLAVLWPVMARAQDAAPPVACGEHPYCTYSESASAGLRFQVRTTCGGVCTSTYWVRDAGTGIVLLSLGPMVGGVMAIPRTATTYPPVRVIQAGYEAGEPLCCPSSLRDTLYVWSGGQYVAGPVTTRPWREDAQGGVVQTLAADQFTAVP